MSLYEQEKLMIRLCLEGDFRNIFFKLPRIASHVSKLSGINVDKIDKQGVMHQGEAINTLLLNDIKDNLSALRLSSGKFFEYYQEYIKSFPYKLESKFEDYIRFLGFLLYKLPDNGFVKLKYLIRFEYSIFQSTLKRERFLEAIGCIINVSNPSTLIINPTLTLLDYKDKNGKKKYLTFYYCGLNLDVNITEINKNLFAFLSTQENIISRTDIIKNLKLKNLSVVDQLIQSGLLIQI